MIHFRFNLDEKIINGDLNNGGHFNAFISVGFLNIICNQTGNSAIVAF